VLAPHPQARLARRRQEVLARHAVPHRRPHRRLPGVEVHVDDPPAGGEARGQAAQVGRTARQVVVRVHDQDEVAAARRQRRPR
jgi:hypothetical protein